ncbi:MAG: lytic transglycosylase, catalytic [Acidobacteria bacterium OLB17]|nr:MAG: lytic transglycosylase, catalytic [Acidobacteria bacterium OLB17]MCZ2391578.1 lytic transglycosylase domain-containing protein [Acidobacteriota bacterium]
MDVLSRAALFERTIADAAQKEGVDPLILWTIAYNETRFRPWLTSPKNAQGLMQFIPATAARFGLADPYEPNASIRAAARYVKHLGRLFDWRRESVLAAYNAGEGTVLAYLEGRTIRAQGKLINPSGRRTIGGIPPYKETVDYVANGRRIYRWLETQGRFPGFRNSPTLDASTQTSVSRKERPEEKGLSEISAMTVLYDPRTGTRSLVKGQGKLELIDNNGPVIISPQVRGLQAQIARSTFAGVLPRDR